MTASSSLPAVPFKSAASALSSFPPLALARPPFFELDADAFVRTEARARTPRAPERAAPAPAPTRPSLSRIGRYTVLTKLATGGMGDVFLAACESPRGFRRVVALKRLREEHASNPMLRAMFLDEARLAARFRHANLVAALELVEDDARPYYTMPWLEGRTLADVIDAAKACGVWPDPSFFLHVVAQALEGLHHAHELRGGDGRALGVVHRDVSPHNIFLTFDGDVRLIDFGVAEFAGPGAAARRGVVAGKRGYISPEHVAGTRLDRRADVFAMGVVAWETLARRGIREPVQVTRAGRRAFSPPSSVARDVPARLDAIVVRALEIDPAARYPTARAMADAIDRHVEQVGTRLRARDVGQIVAAYFHEERRRLDALVATQPARARRARPSQVPAPPQQPQRAQSAQSPPPLPSHAIDPAVLASFLDRALRVGRIGVAMITLAIVLTAMSFAAIAMNDPVTAALLRATVGR